MKRTLRTLAVYAYGFGSILAGLLVLAGVNALITTFQNGGTVTAIGVVSTSFIPMLALMVLVFLAQRRRETLALLPIPVVIGAAVALLFAMGSHWRPQTVADQLGFVHLALVASGVAWAIYELRMQVAHGAKPSNPPVNMDARDGPGHEGDRGARASYRER